MKYCVAHLDYHFAEDWERDIFEQQLFDLGFDTIDGTDAYIPAALLNEPALQQLLVAQSGATLVGIEECPDENWNATWEAEHPMMELAHGVRIIPHCAFGAGHHETTGMIIDALTACPPVGLRVLDNGCGTGVLGIMAAKLGAADVVAVDIDDKSVSNTEENAALNEVNIDVRLGDTPPAGQYDLIMSNIHRNILLLQMPLYAQYLSPNGSVILSGFYEEDIPAILQAAKAVGLRLAHTSARGEWRMLCLKDNIER